MKKSCIYLLISGILLLTFLVLTISLLSFDVRAIGPEESHVGFASVNMFIFEKIGVNYMWYEITDYLGIVAILLAFSFGILGLVQWIFRSSIFKVDKDILALGVLYLILVALYIFFEIYIVNYRPLILQGNLEASFPSSHTMLVIGVLGTAIIQFQKRVKNNFVKKTLQISVCGIIIITIVGRMISGVHWFTDIVAALLLGTSLVSLYNFVFQWIEYKKSV